MAVDRNFGFLSLKILLMNRQTKLAENLADYRCGIFVATYISLRKFILTATYKHFSVGSKQIKSKFSYLSHTLPDLKSKMAKFLWKFLAEILQILDFL